MRKTPTIAPVLRDEALYVGDNGALFCGKDAGASARFTGRDISGQRVERVTLKMAERSGLPVAMWRCESCARTLLELEGGES